MSSGDLMAATTLKVATFNVSMESENYLPRGSEIQPQLLQQLLAAGDNQQIKNIASIIQQVRPDVILLNEFDYIADPEQGVQLFINNYLNKSQSGQKAIHYPYFYYNTVNTGQPSGFDLDNDGVISASGSDAWGFGQYPGHYGMVVLSKYPIDSARSRTFQHFKWKDMPGFLPTLKADGSEWYSQAAWQQMPLSSKSHWDLTVNIEGTPLHLLVSHPTPPVFDGIENRNGKRNHDEVRFWVDYLTKEKANYIYDDQGQHGGLAQNSSFVLVGDMNSSPDEGDAYREAISGLVHHELVNSDMTPSSNGGKEHSPDNPFAKYHTAAWRMRADYVLPSKHGIKPKSSGVFWPAQGEALYQLVADRGSSSDHRLVCLGVAPWIVFLSKSSI